jgi:uncharacterized iron-regulated membrane protein
VRRKIRGKGSQVTKKAWFQLHTWAGIFLGALLLLVCITGTLATISHEIEYLTDHKFRALTSRTQVDFQQLESELSTHYPNSHLQRIQIRPEKYLSGEAHLVKDNLLSFVYFDPNTGKILGEGQWGRLARFLRDIHRKLSMGDAGKLLVTALSLLLVTILVSSFFVYKGWWRCFFKRPSQFDSSKRTSWSRWHKFIGVWSWWFVAVITLTGFWYFINQSLETAKIEYYPQAPGVQTLNIAAKPLSLTKVLMHAQSAFEMLDITYVRYPDSVQKPIEIRGNNDDFLVADRANRIYLHPVSGQVLKVQYATELSIYARFTDTVDLIHFGHFSGLITKLIWFVFGSLLSFLIASGIYMAWLKTKRKQASVIKWQGVSGIFAIIMCCAALILTSISVAMPEQESTPFSPQLLVTLAL